MPSWNIRLTGLHPGPSTPTPNTVRIDDAPTLHAAKLRVIRIWSDKIGRHIREDELSGERINTDTPHYVRPRHPERIISHAERSLPRGDRDD